MQLNHLTKEKAPLEKREQNDRAGKRHIGEYYALRLALCPILKLEDRLIYLLRNGSRRWTNSVTTASLENFLSSSSVLGTGGHAFVVNRPLGRLSMGEENAAWGCSKNWPRVDSPAGSHPPESLGSHSILA